jgi:hypothetical protein
MLTQTVLTVAIKTAFFHRFGPLAANRSYKLVEGHVTVASSQTDYHSARMLTPQAYYRL